MPLTAPSLTCATASGLAQSEQKFSISVGAEYGGIHRADQLGSGELGQGEAGDIGQHLFLHGGVADDAASFIDLGFAGFKLWLHESDESTARSEFGPNSGQHFAQRDEREVHDDRIEMGAGQIGFGERAGVEFFDVGDPRVIEEFGVELSSPNIDTHDIGCAGLQRAISEAARGRAHVEHVKVGEGNLEILEESGELFPPATHETGRLIDGDIEVGWIDLAGLFEAGRAEANATTHDEGFGLGAGVGEVAGDEELVEALFLGRAHDLRRIWRAGDQQVVRPPISARSSVTLVRGQIPPSRQR